MSKRDVGLQILNPDARVARLEILGRAALQMAGFQPRFLKRAMARTVSALDARRVVFFQNGGVVRDKRVTIDHGTRLNAADKLFRMANAYPRESEAKKSGGAAIVVEIANLAPDGSKTTVRIGAKS